MQSSDFTLHGAIDLGARQAATQARAKAQERAQQAPQAEGGGGQHVIDVTDETFTAEVVGQSQSVPVLVDFWAEWCQPCKQLGPILEKLAAEAAGRWILARVDIDANPALAAQMQRMGVQGIPFVAAVVAGQMIPLFQGAYPEPQIRQALDQMFDALNQQGMLSEEPPAATDDQAEPQPTGDPLREAAEEALRSGDIDAAEEAFRKILEKSPGDPDAKSGLALVGLQQRVRTYDPAEARREATDHPGDAGAQCRVADLDIAEGRIDEAFDRLLGAIRRLSGDEREKARVRLLELFELLPPDEPRLARARRALSAALF